MNSIISKIKRYLLRFALIQLFLTLVSLPIQIAWGLPISLLSPIGNLIFNPFLSLFLFLSSLMFFCKLLWLPTGLIVWLLEQTTYWWLTVLDWHNANPCIAFAQPSWLVLSFIPLGAIALVTTHLYKTVVSRVFALTVFLLFIGILMKSCTTQTRFIHQIRCGEGVVTLILKENKLILVDPGAISRNPSAPSWASYDLTSEIIRKTGKLTIDAVIALRPGTRTWKALTKLAEKMPIKKMYVPFFQGRLTRAQWYHFRTMEQSLRMCGGTLARFNTKRVSIEQWCIIEPLKQCIEYQDISYQSARVIGEVDRIPFTIYATHHIHES